MAKRQETEASSDLLNVPATGATGKRPFVEGIAMPFTLKKEAETASMLTLDSTTSPAPATRPQSPQQAPSANGLNGTVPDPQHEAASSTTNGLQSHDEKTITKGHSSPNGAPTPIST
jgi:hypothetical protein